MINTYDTYGGNLDGDRCGSLGYGGKQVTVRDAKNEIVGLVTLERGNWEEVEHPLFDFASCTSQFSLSIQSDEKFYSINVEGVSKGLEVSREELITGITMEVP
ncbi:MAG TPA: hypothetical protein PK781_00975 [Terrimesophilobacter sp.]|nr:hypothetical protein [Terrimesophilobacter sp.]